MTSDRWAVGVGVVVAALLLGLGSWWIVDHPTSVSASLIQDTPTAAATTSHQPPRPPKPTTAAALEKALHEAGVTCEGSDLGTAACRTAADVPVDVVDAGIADFRGKEMRGVCHGSSAGVLAGHAIAVAPPYLLVAGTDKALTGLAGKIGARVSACPGTSGPTTATPSPS